MGIRGGDFVYIRLMLGIVTCGMGVWKKLLLLGQIVGVTRPSMLLITDHSPWHRPAREKW